MRAPRCNSSGAAEHDVGLDEGTGLHFDRVVDDGSAADGRAGDSNAVEDAGDHPVLGFCELGAVIDAHEVVRGPWDVDDTAMLHGHGDEIGQVEFSLGIVVLEASETLPEEVRPDAVHAGVDLVDHALGLVQVPILADGRRPDGCCREGFCRSPRDWRPCR